MSKRNILILFIFLLILLIPYKVFAAGNVSVVSSKSSVISGEEFEESVDLSGVPACAFQLELSFDGNKLEYISGPENSNMVSNTALYTWVDSTGGSSPIKDGTAVTFKFKAKAAGEAVFGIKGMFFDKDSNEIMPVYKGGSVTISNTAGAGPMPAKQSTDPSNAYLGVMRLGVEGISPDFDKNITEYNLIIGTDVSDLNITALPENPESRVNIYGDKGLKTGLNKVQIEVISKDGSQKRTYTVNVTKTGEPAKANADLQMLSVENFNITPNFSAGIMLYKASVPSNVEKVNVFAAAESINANVKITGAGLVSARTGRHIKNWR
ncbi:MAG: cadherin-like beta sandwich domain-containing protein [Firmicutes bacterium]|nr:cadherin-like beta sandwich domain-containing protein [Bacillota bacterium]